jgi:hypothetical protein
MKGWNCSLENGEKVMRSHIAAFVIAFILPITSVTAEEFSAESIGAIMGVKATTTPDGVVRVGWARKDVPVTVDGTKFKPFAGLGTWAAFLKTEHGAMVMGDTVVFQDEVNPAIDAAFANGLEVTALHNHFFFDEPKVYFMHIGGMDDPEKLAKSVKAVWDAVKKVRAANSKPATSFDGGSVDSNGSLNQEALAKHFDVKPASEDGIVKFTINREAEMHGSKFGGSLGLTTWAAFTGSDDHAAIDGDLAMEGHEMKAVLQALRKEKINIVALHNHMVGEKPAYFFVHFWGKGKAGALAESFQRVLAAQKQAAASKGDGHGEDK